MVGLLFGVTKKFLSQVESDSMSLNYSSVKYRINKTSSGIKISTQCSVYRMGLSSARLETLSSHDYRVVLFSYCTLPHRCTWTIIVNFYIYKIHIINDNHSFSLSIIQWKWFNLILEMPVFPLVNELFNVDREFIMKIK